MASTAVALPLPAISANSVYESEHNFRNYADGELQERVERTYRLMHTNQTLDFVLKKKQEWCQLNHAELTIMEVCDLLDGYVDESDPDNDLPNSVHAYQTAEAIRAHHPDKEWLIFTGFIHDLGKVMGLWGEQQWATVGDTFPLGCRFDEANVFGRESFRQNPDFDHPVYSTPLGMYQENCGLDNVVMSWGHDEYLYQVLVRNGCPMPREGLYIIRFHSFYPSHTFEAYRQLWSDEDHELMKWVRNFQKYDLYSKSPELPDLAELRRYYSSLADKFAPGKLKW